MKTKPKPHEKSHRGFDAKTFWRHYVATVDTDQEWSQERTQAGRGSNRLFLFLLLFHIFLIGSVVLYNLVSERPKPVFVDNSVPKTMVSATKKPTTGDKQTPAAPATSSAKQTETVEHRVAQGDSLKSIADASGVSQEEIAKMNHIDVNMQLAVGSVLRVPKPKTKPPVIPVGQQPVRVDEKIVATTAPGAAAIFTAVEPAPAVKRTEPAPAVKKTEAAPAPKKTETIASKPPEEKAKPKVEDSPPPAPKPKTTEKIAESPPAAKSKPTETKAVARTDTPPGPAAKPAEPKTTETAKPAASSTTHTVKPKETFYSISRKYGVKVEDLMRVNNFTDPGKLREGIVLKVPAKG